MCYVVFFGQGHFQNYSLSPFNLLEEIARGIVQGVVYVVNNQSIHHLHVLALTIFT